jgi:membrane-associated phospholipid phosphatase
MQTLLGLAGTAALVTVAYFFLDGPALAFIRGYRLDRYPLLKWLTRPPEAFILVSLFVLPACLLRRWFGPWTWGEKAAAAAAVATLLTAAAVGLLKMAFGRCGDGFRPFDFAAPYWAFPSGHTACTLSATVVAQAALPRWRLCWWSVAGVVAANE